MTSGAGATGLAEPSRATVGTSEPDGSDDARRWLRPVGLVGGWTALLAPFALQAAFILRANHVSFIQRLPDDAFYYLEIAARVARGEGFTFDGIHATNGFHPLWELMLVPAVGLGGAGATTDGGVRAALLLGLLCCLVAVLLVVRLARRVAGWGPALFGGVVATQFGLAGWLDGMEGPAVLLTLALLATALADADHRPTALRAAVVGVASAFVVLARLDFAPLLLVLALALWLRWRSVRRFGAWLGGCAAIGIPATIWWIASFGHVLSVSAVVKNHWMSQQYDAQYGGRATWGFVRHVADVAQDYVSRLDVWSALRDGSVGTRSLGAPTMLAKLSALVLLGLAIAGGATTLRQRFRDAPRPALGADAWALAVVLVVVVGKALLDIVVVPPWASFWYAAPVRFAVAFLLGASAWCGVRRLAARSWPVAGVAVACLVYLAIPVNSASWLNEVHGEHVPSGWQDQIDAAADWISVAGPAGRYGARDAGILGFRLDGSRAVVNLDGLVNDYDFAELVAAQAPLIDRLRATEVDYFVGRIMDDELQSIAPCGPVLWSSPDVVFHSSQGITTSAPVRVVDVRACTASRDPVASRPSTRRSAP